MGIFSNSLTEYSPQMEGPEFFSNTEWEGNTSTGVFGEKEELELTVGLLEVRNEEELDYFLGGLIQKAGKAIGKVVTSPTGKAVGRVLKKAVGKILPVAGAAVGGWFGGPLGAQIGKRLAATAGQTLGLELEGLSPADREFEAARQFVRFAGETARNALESGRADPVGVARRSAAKAGRAHAPGLVQVTPARVTPNEGLASTSSCSGCKATTQYQETNAMHDIDRNQAEFGYEMENPPFQSYEMENPPYQSEESVFNETEEMEFASQLMELDTEEEFEDFLGSLIMKAISRAGGRPSSEIGQSLGSLLKGAARQILPQENEADGAGELDEFEDENSYSQEFEADELEWEAASTFVKLAGEAARIAAQAPPNAPPPDVADHAVTQAAQVHAPALVEQAPAGAVGPRMGARSSVMRRRRRRQGRWIRRGNTIILLGA